MVTVYMRAGARDFIGDTMLLVEEMEPGLVKDMWVNLVGPAPTQKGLQKKLGKNMAEEGWAPKLPIVIVPGTLGRVSILSLTHPFTHTHSCTNNERRIWLDRTRGHRGLREVEGRARVALHLQDRRPGSVDQVSPLFLSFLFFFHCLN
jgi:hypothetical protein